MYRQSTADRWIAKATAMREEMTNDKATTSKLNKIQYFTVAEK